ncbi:hypothetical protein ACQKM9_17190 [Viridibacillus sp. NPDC093762]|uniref:hypothetical protein n=1 Tax=Viridibacillus sp. NPDC093762 TaxID=3390720 RepID=UPI003CFCE282
MEKFNGLLLVSVLLIFGVTVMGVSGNLGSLSDVLASLSDVLDSFNGIIQSLGESAGPFSISIYTVFRKERK